MLSSRCRFTDGAGGASHRIFRARLFDSVFAILRVEPSINKRVRLFLLQLRRRGGVVWTFLVVPFPMTPSTEVVIRRLCLGQAGVGGGREFLDFHKVSTHFDGGQYGRGTKGKLDRCGGFVVWRRSFNLDMSGCGDVIEFSW